MTAQSHFDRRFAKDSKLTRGVVYCRCCFNHCKHAEAGGWVEHPHLG
jgi:hypothetical protein